MRISVNLASRPFVELRPLFARLRIAMGALALLAIGLGFALSTLSARAKIATARMEKLTGQTNTVLQERATNERRMHQPQNQGILSRSQFLNALFARKSFSWTAVMMDLEHVLPVGVQVTSIEPVISKEGDVTIRLRVTGDRDKSLQLVRNLEKSQRFLKPRLANETTLAADKVRALNGGPPSFQNASLNPADLGSAVEFEIFSGYNPLPEPTPTKGKRKTADDENPEDAPDIIPAMHHNRRAGAAQIKPGGVR